jgi:uncharacterized protein (DUF1697 family)
MKTTVYLILFRGVGGATQLPTKVLRQKLMDAGFENVTTYINSGNAVVCSRLTRKKVVATIAELCREEFAFDKAIFAPTLDEWETVLANNPFGREAEAAPTCVHVAILEGTPKTESVARIRACAVDGEDLQIVGGVAYLHTPNGLGKSRMAAKFDAWIGVANTARNWNTARKLSELGREAKARI